MAKMSSKKEKPTTINIPNQLNAATNIVGSITLEGHLRMDGKIKGDITCSGKLVIGEKAEVLGNIHCQSADIMGTVHGEVRVKQNTSLFSKSMVKGNVYTLSINIEPGAVFNGKCIMSADEK
jgi:cytoskeletal protein CcmA (bactofilin family)